MPSALFAYDSARYLNTLERQAEYLNLAIEEDDGDGKAIAAALTVLARAQDLANGAETPEESRQSLVRNLAGDGTLSMANALRICRVLGLELAAYPHAAE